MGKTFRARQSVRPGDPGRQAPFARIGRYRAARAKLDQDAVAGMEALRVWVASRRERAAGR